MREETVSCVRCQRRYRVAATVAEPPSCGVCGIALPWLSRADDDNFAEIVQVGVPVVVTISARWCSPCRVVTPALERVTRERLGEVKLVRVDVDAAPGLSRRLSVTALPTLLVLRDGEVVARRERPLSAASARRWLRDMLVLAAQVREPERAPRPQVTRSG